MKKIESIALFTLLLLITSCVGQVEPEANPKVTIVASQPNLSIDNGETVKIRVKNYSVDVTDQADIYYLDEGEEVAVSYGEFTATQSGEYTLYARYNGYDSESSATVWAYTDSELSDTFFRRHIVMKFTGTWCVNCPSMGEAITEVEHEMPHRIVEMAVHNSDALAVDEGDLLVTYFKCSVLPTTIIDFDTSSKIVISSVTKIKEGIENADSNYSTVSGVRLTTSIENSTLNIEAGVTATQENNYKLAVAVVMDNYQYSQTGASYANYKQDKVLRYYATDTFGDNLTSLIVGQEAVATFSETLPSEALTSECRVIAYVLSEQSDGSYIVNNATECIAGESIDYMYELK